MPLSDECKTAASKIEKATADLTKRAAKFSKLSADLGSKPMSGKELETAQKDLDDLLGEADQGLKSLEDLSRSVADAEREVDKIKEELSPLVGELDRAVKAKGAEVTAMKKVDALVSDIQTSLKSLSDGMKANSYGHLGGILNALSADHPDYAALYKIGSSAADEWGKAQSALSKAKLKGYDLTKFMKQYGY